jgi:TfuA protein
MPPDPAAVAGLSGAVVFVGPSLPRNYSVSPLIHLRPPVRRGDIAQLRLQQPSAVGIIDGEFFQNLAVSPMEVLSLLRAGITVYGSSSMGALRAVELRSQGMIGVGTVYRLFRRGYLDADDEVAVTWSPETGRRTSTALVDTRWALRQAVRAEILTSAEAHSIVAGIKQTYFPGRTDELTLFVAQNIVGRERTLDLKCFLPGETTTIKERDALLLLKRMAEVHKAPVLDAPEH